MHTNFSVQIFQEYLREKVEYSQNHSSLNLFVKKSIKKCKKELLYKYFKILSFKFDKSTPQQGLKQGAFADI